MTAVDYEKADLQLALDLFMALVAVLLLSMGYSQNQEVASDLNSPRPRKAINTPIAAAIQIVPSEFADTFLTVEGKPFRPSDLHPGQAIVLSLKSDFHLRQVLSTKATLEQLVGAHQIYVKTAE